MSNENLNRVEKWLLDHQDHGLPVTGFEFEQGRTAVVITDPQKDFLDPTGVAWGAVGESVLENNTVENLTALMNATVESGTPLVISPHYYYPTDHKWKFEGTLEKLMHAINMFDRKGALDIEGFEGSGADWLEPLKPAINHEDTVICGAHKVYGPENNDLILQLQKLRVEKVLLAGMSANLCVESHLRELVERGFEVAVVADSSAAAKVPGLDGMEAALTNYRMIASDILTTKQAVATLLNNKK